MQVDFNECVDEYKNRTVVVNAVKWRCPDCSFEFSEREMKNAAQKYVAQNPDAIKNGVRSFWVNGFSSTFLSWKIIMQEYLESKGDPVRESVVFNTRFGVSYELKGEFNDENVFLKRKEDCPAQLPEGVLLLTAGIDVQANRLEISVFGWTFGETAFAICHQIIRGSPNDAATFKALDIFLDREWQFADGSRLKIARAFIDSGYNAKVIYEYCRTHISKGVFAIKGSGQIGTPLLSKYTYPKGHGIILTILGVNDGKNTIFSRLAIDKPQNAGYIHFYNDTENFRRGFDLNYFKQLVAEKRVVRKSGGLVNSVYENINNERNEALDCAVYAYSAMKSCIGNLNGDDFFKRLATPEIKKPETKKTPAKVVSRSIDIY